MKLARTTAAAALFAIAGSIGLADAQDTGQPKDQPADGSMMGPWMGGPWMMGPYGNMPMMNWNTPGAPRCGMMSGHIDGRLAYQKAELKITAAQEALWSAYATAARNNAESMTAHCSAMMGSGADKALSLPDRMDQHVTFMESQIGSLKMLNAALKPLYAALSNEQKAAADQMIWGPMGMM